MHGESREIPITSPKMARSLRQPYGGAGSVFCHEKVLESVLVEAGESGGLLALQRLI
jgi:hypothetical protein